MFPAPRFMFSNLPMHRAARSIWKRYARLFKPPHFVEKRMGAYWLLDQHSLIDRLMFCQGFYEEDQMARLIALAKALGTKDGKPLFLDIGSHAGLYAILLSKTGVFAKVIAFEPLEENLGQLRANLFLNDLAGTIDLREYALSDAAATLRFANGPQDNRGMGGVASADAKDIIMIEAKRGDDVIETRGGVLAIKIDVEGHESAVIAGMHDVLRTNRCVLQVEILPDAHARVTTELATLGYRHLGVVGWLDNYFTNDPAITA